MLEHEYAVLGGLNRAAIGRYISFVASGLASALGIALTALIDLTRNFGIYHPPPIILWPITAGLLYTILYWWFNTSIWKYSRLATLLKVPNLSGEWTCIGKIIDPTSEKQREWQATITIVQSWDKLRIRLQSENSTSNSTTAALVHDEAAGYRLIYSYKNEPNIESTQLTSHRGSADLLFNKELTQATGDYFNGHGRYTFGTLQLTRKKDEKRH